MPIKGLSDRLRLVRRGKIRLGEKRTSEKTGKEYPVALDYFVVPPEVMEIYGDRPKKLDVMLPMENTENFFPQWFKRYGQSKGLICKGDGESATRINEKGEMEEIACLGPECPYTKDRVEKLKTETGKTLNITHHKECKAIGSLQVILPKVEGLGVYQIDTSSVNSIINLNSCIEMIRGMVGRVSWIPLILEVTIQEAHPLVNGNRIKVKIPVMSLTTQTTIPEMLKMRKENVKVSLPEPEKVSIKNDKIDEKEDLLYSDTDKNSEPKDKEIKKMPGRVTVENGEPAEVKRVPVREESERRIPKARDLLREETSEDKNPILQGKEPEIPPQYNIGERKGEPVGEQIQEDKKKKLIQQIHIKAGELRKAEIWGNDSYIKFLEKRFKKHSSKDMSVKELEIAVDLMEKILEAPSK